jgi:hypothetical protein
VTDTLQPIRLFHLLRRLINARASNSAGTSGSLSKMDLDIATDF